jgi:hypothetical protein
MAISSSLSNNCSVEIVVYLALHTKKLFHYLLRIHSSICVLVENGLEMAAVSCVVLFDCLCTVDKCSAVTDVFSEQSLLLLL